jgi:hypothetical protein
LGGLGKVESGDRSCVTGAWCS